MKAKAGHERTFGKVGLKSKKNPKRKKQARLRRSQTPQDSLWEVAEIVKVLEDRERIKQGGMSDE